MKRNFVAFTIALLSFIQLSAQPALYGVLPEGGASSAGTLFKLDAQTHALEVKHNFTDVEGSNPYGTLLYASDGMLYGTTNEGGSSGFGTLFQYNPQTGVLTTKANFDYDITGGYNFGQLIQLQNGDIVGVCSSGGVYGYGTIWKYVIASNQLTKLQDFDEQSGTFPYTGVTQASNGKLYGVTTNDGGSYYGALYEFDPLTNSLTTLQSFDYSNGGYGFAQLIEVNGKLIGVTYYGGAGNAGTIFDYDLNSNLFATRYSFDYGDNGGMPYGGGLNLASNGLLYGTTSAGGLYGEGTLFGYDPISGNFTKLHDFNIVGKGPSYCPVMQASDGNLYGMTYQGSDNGIYNNGSIFKYEISSNTYTTIKDLDENSGGKPSWTGLTEIKAVVPPNCNPSGIKAGSIAFTGSFNPNISNKITSVAPATPVTGTAPVEYIWLKSLVNVPNTVGNPHWKVVTGSKNQVELNLEQLVETSYFIRCSRLLGCDKYWGETNIVKVPVDLCHSNYINSGSIAFEGSYNPNQTNIVTNVEAGSSDFSEELNIEYIWLKSNVNTPNVVGNPHWKVVEGSQNQLALTLGGLVSTTYFIRCARVEGCIKYWGETNIVEVPVDLCHPNYINSGSIAFEGNYNPNQTNIVTNVEAGSSDFSEELNIEYIWLKSNVNTPNVVGNPHWKVVEGSENQLALTLGGLASTTFFIRCARVESCTKYWGETNIVKVPVDLCHPNYINSGSIAFEGSYNPNQTNIVTNVEAGSSDFDEEINIEYIWLRSDVNKPNTVGNPYWTVVEGSENQLELTLSGLVSTTYFIRCARAEECEIFWGETNIVKVPVDLCHPNYINPGSIAFEGSYSPNQNNIITNVEAGSSDFGEEINIEYIWLKSDVNKPNTVGNPYWTVVEGSKNQLALTLSGLASTTYFIRCARAESCTKYWGETNMVEVPVELCIHDNTPPIVVAQDVTIYLGPDGIANVMASEIDNGSTDNCEIASYSLSKSSFTCDDVGVNEINLTVTDAAGNSAVAVAHVTVVNEAPVITAVKAPETPQALSSQIEVEVSFSDTNVTGGSIAWGDGTSSSGELDGEIMTGTHTYETPGIYNLVITVTDVCALAAITIRKQIEIYDPNGLCVSGGGWIDSPSNSCHERFGKDGKGAFDIEVGYTKESESPVGHFEFNLKSKSKHGDDDDDGDDNQHDGNDDEYKNVNKFSFHSTSFDWWIVNGKKGIGQGSGELNGDAGYFFIFSVVDDVSKKDNHGKSKKEGHQYDKLRIRIWNAEGVVYDNEKEAPIYAEATSPIRYGHIKIHDCDKEDDEREKEEEKEVADRSKDSIPGLKCFPSPIKSSLTVNIPDANSETTFDLTDFFGHQIKIAPMPSSSRETHSFDVEGLPSGMYILTVHHGSYRERIRILKK